MEKQIKVNNSRILCLDILAEYLSSTITIREAFLNNGELVMDYTLSRYDDYSFNVFLEDYDNVGEVSFNFDIDHPLYFPLLHLLGNDNSLIIDDDDTLELEEKYLEIKKDNNDIKLSFVNKLKEELDYEKFNIFIKNTCFDGRSKIDQQYKDTKERLTNFFNEVVKTLTEEYHQTTIEEYMVKRKVLKNINK